MYTALFSATQKIEMFLKIRTDRAVLVREEGSKTPAPPLQPIRLGAQGHPWVRFVAYPNTINLTEAIFKFPSQSRDMGARRGDPIGPPGGKKWWKFFFFIFSIFTIGMDEWMSVVTGYQLFLRSAFFFHGKILGWIRRVEKRKTSKISRSAIVHQSISRKTKATFPP